MSGKRSLTVRFDLERNETWRYERNEMAAAIAAYAMLNGASISALHVVYLAMHDCVLSIDNDFSRRRDHEGRHHW
jgi:hypothetical protein